MAPSEGTSRRQQLLSHKSCAQGLTDSKKTPRRHAQKCGACLPAKPKPVGQLCEAVPAVLDVGVGAAGCKSRQRGQHTTYEGGRIAVKLPVLCPAVRGVPAKHVAPLVPDQGDAWAWRMQGVKFVAGVSARLSDACADRRRCKACMQGGETDRSAGKSMLLLQGMLCLLACQVESFRGCTLAAAAPHEGVEAPAMELAVEQQLPHLAR